jgi:hypothetical protein
MHFTIFWIAVVAAEMPQALGFVPVRNFGSSWNTPLSVPFRPFMATKSLEDVMTGHLLSDLPTPCLILELSLAENASGGADLDELLSSCDSSKVAFDGCLFVHTKLTDTSERDQMTRVIGSGKCSMIGHVDVNPEWIPGGAFLGIGLANHHVGGYYWARGMGIGASLPAHGVAYDVSEDTDVGKLFWRKRGPGLDAMETTQESSNSNDGKRSEWADFLAVGDTVQLIPYLATEVLKDSRFDVLLGMRRIGRPLGADPIVERIWRRSKDSRVVWVRH